jgi:FkbM family methyltransferase
LNGPGCIIDIGANIGLTTALLAKVRPGDVIYAIEPSLKTFRNLSKTIAANALVNVKAINIGLGAKSGKLILNEDPSNSSAANFSSDALLDDEDPRGVAVQTLDDFCSSYGIRPHFLKIDVEGFELNVLKGGLQTIKECSPVLFIEMNTFTMLAYGRVNPLEVIDFLRRHFHEVLWLNGADIEQMNSERLLTEFLHAHYSRNSGIDDLLCIPHGVSINRDALRADIERFRVEPSSANARLEAVLNSTTWRLAKNIQCLAARFKRGADRSL